MVKDYKRTVSAIVKEMKAQAAQAHTGKAEVDISGGVDSAVVVALACKAFGPENVIGVYSSVDSSEESRNNARQVAEVFGFKLIELELSGVFTSICTMVRAEFRRLNIPLPDPNTDPTIFGGFRSCIRAPIGRFINRAFGGGIRQGTGNRDEDELLRFYQKGGDGEVDCNWIGGLFKGEVWELAEYLGVPWDVIGAKPTPDLWGVGDIHNDEDELKVLTGVDLTYSYPGEEMGTIEWVIRENDEHGVVDGLFSWLTRDELKLRLDYSDEQLDVIEAVRKIEKATRHKARMPPILNRKYLVGIGAVE